MNTPSQVTERYSRNLTHDFLKLQGCIKSFLSFALAAGVGLGLCSLTAVIIVAKHCAEGRATVEFGLATSGIGTGMFVFPVLNE